MDHSSARVTGRSLNEGVWACRSTWAPGVLERGCIQGPDADVAPPSLIDGWHLLCPPRRLEVRVNARKRWDAVAKIHSERSYKIALHMKVVCICLSHSQGHRKKWNKIRSSLTDNQTASVLSVNIQTMHVPRVPHKIHFVYKYRHLLFTPSHPVCFSIVRIFTPFLLAISESLFLFFFFVPLHVSALQFFFF